MERSAEDNLKEFKKLMDLIISLTDEEKELLIQEAMKHYPDDDYETLKNLLRKIEIEWGETRYKNKVLPQKENRPEGITITENFKKPKLR